MRKELCSENQVIWNRWYKNAQQTPDRDAIIHWIAGEEPFRWTFCGLMDAAEDMAAMLIQHNVRQGDVCAIVIRRNRLLYPLYLATVCIGAIPAILAYPNPRLHPDKFRRGLEGMSLRSGLDWVFTEHDLDETIRPLIEREGSTIKGVRFPLEWKKGNGVSGEKLNDVVNVQNRISSSDP